MDDKRTLIVDDERRVADSLRTLLDDAGCHVRMAYGGAEAIEQLNREQFQVVVTDLRMQEVSGAEVIRFVHENHPRALIIVITGHATTESAIEAVHYQVFDYLRKPFAFDLFRMAIEKAFQKTETEQLREDTAAMITHDIKITLTSIIGFASMIYDHEKGGFHPRAREFAETVHASGQKILELIENYLTTCKIEAGTLKAVATEVNLHRMIEDVVETLRVEAERRGQCIESDLRGLLATVFFDEMMIYQAVGNMLNNAFKYGSPDAPIEIIAEKLEASRSPLDLDSICIQVVNETEAFLPEDFDDIFNRFERAGVRRGIEGSGIDLYVVKTVAHAHRGRVGAGLAEEGRVQFSIILPLKLDEPEATVEGTARLRDRP